MAIVTFVTKDNARADCVNGLTQFLAFDVKFKEQFPNFGTVRVGSVHPFAIVNSAMLAGQPDPPNVFPCVSVSFVTENAKNPNFLGRQTDSGFFTQAKLDEWTALPVNRRLIAASTLAQLQTYLTADRKMRYWEFAQLYTARIVFSIWADNDDVKDAIYLLARAFVEAYQDAVFSANGWGEIDWSSDRDGLYNFDFGRTLYGASLTVNGTAIQRSTVIETDEEAALTGVLAPIIQINAVENGITFKSPSEA